MGMFAGVWLMESTRARLHLGVIHPSRRASLLHQPGLLEFEAGGCFATIVMAGCVSYVILCMEDP